MAEQKSAADTTAPTQGNDHDKVAMLSISKDGTPDQHDPEIIGDKEFALEATKRQFAENAVSAVDQDLRVVAGSGGEELKQDPAIEALKAEHDKVAAAAEKAAEKVVDALHKG